ncbi:hypothetical protein [Angustibacter aerolatus]
MSDRQPAEPGERGLRRVHRAPKYQVFIAAGLIVGIVVAVVSGYTGAGDPTVGRGKLVGYLALLLGCLGGLLGGAVAVTVERFMNRGTGRR